MLWPMTLLRELKCMYQCSDWIFCGYILSQPDCVCVLVFAIRAYLYFHSIRTLLCFSACYCVFRSCICCLLRSFSVLRNKRSINPGMVTSGTHRVCLFVCGSSFMACGFTQYSYWSLTEDCFFFVFLFMP